MPLISIFWGFIVPSGVILYWVTSNGVQIGQHELRLVLLNLQVEPADALVV